MNAGRIVRRVVAPIAGAVLAALGVAFAVDNLPVAADAGMPPGLQVCDFEDSRNCYWDATTSGNGAGRSFYDIGGETYYLP